MSSNMYMISFGIVEIIFSQIPGFDQLWWLSIVAAVMSFTYSTIGLGLGIGKVIENRGVRGSLTEITIGTVTQTKKVWRTMQALGTVVSKIGYVLNSAEAETLLSATLIHEDVKLLIDDVGELKPTIFCVVPHVLDRVYSGLTQKISSGGFLKKTLFNFAYSYFKVMSHWTKKGLRHGEASPLLDKIVFDKPLKVDGRNVGRTKSIIHLPTDFLFIVTVFVRRYRSFFL
ncbi:Amino acid permease 3 [Glycine soja]|uniref:Amino acid permease 3 n=1 Tax=Glycine soja TaxID=3848 RepID=A0A0B2NVM5_GLYSO|nr:Amino acid permease 3 [Glycine soja]